MSSTASIFLWDLWCLWTSLSGFTDRSETRETFPRTETIRSHNSSASKPSILNPVSREIISDSVELWEMMFVSYTSNLLEQMYDFQKRIMFLQKWILNLQDLPQSQSPETVPICIDSSISHMTTPPAPTRVMNIWNQSIQTFVTKLWSIFVMDRASLFTDHRTSSRPIRFQV